MRHRELPPALQVHVWLHLAPSHVSVSDYEYLIQDKIPAGSENSEQVPALQPWGIMGVVTVCVLCWMVCVVQILSSCSTHAPPGPFVLWRERVWAPTLRWALTHTFLFPPETLQTHTHSRTHTYLHTFQEIRREWAQTADSFLTECFFLCRWF